MKKSRTILLAALCMLTSVTTITTTGQSAPVINDLTSEKSIRFIKAENNQLVFEIHLNALYKSSLTILDEKDQELYTETIDPAIFTRRYKINLEDISVLKFRIQCRGKYIAQDFSVSRQVEEKLVVTKVK